MYDTNIEGTTDINTIYSTEENMKFRKLILRMIGLAIVVSLYGSGFYPLSLSFAFPVPLPVCD